VARIPQSLATHLTMISFTRNCDPYCSYHANMYFKNDPQIPSATQKHVHKGLKRIFLNLTTAVNNAKNKGCVISNMATDVTENFPRLVIPQCSPFNVMYCHAQAMSLGMKRCISFIEPKADELMIDFYSTPGESSVPGSIHFTVEILCVLNLDWQLIFILTYGPLTV
jgi:hypothetical protein